MLELPRRSTRTQLYYTLHEYWHNTVKQSCRNTRRNRTVLHCRIQCSYAHPCLLETQNSRMKLKSNSRIIHSKKLISLSCQSLPCLLIVVLVSLIPLCLSSLFVASRIEASLGDTRRRPLDYHTNSLRSSKDSIDACVFVRSSLPRLE